VRLFLAINPPDDVRRAIIDGTASLREVAPDVRWVDEARLHLTLKFLGEQPEDATPRLCEAMDGVTRRHRAFAMQVADVGAFPNFRRARVVWMGIRHEPRLELLHHDVEVACEKLGFEVEGRSFRPHLTLARVRDDVPEGTLRALARSAKRVTFTATAPVDRVDLMRSNPGRDGARYECLHAAHLRAD
jgi:RNA 2',3'-cyclic 3'-phosphodiesterase